ncbi:hypothetical protein JOM56_008351 [Amanita muscaria]
MSYNYMPPTAAHHRNSTLVDTVELRPLVPTPHQSFLTMPGESTLSRKKTTWKHFSHKGKKQVGLFASLNAIVFSSWLNLFLVFLPLGWISHFVTVAAKENGKEVVFWSGTTTFTFCFLGIMPLQKLFEYGGDQMACYLGEDFGDLLVITLANVVEGTLAIILLVKNELKLLQSTVIGVVILHLLLIPGVSFFVGGARLAHQELHPRFTQLNQTLLCIGVLTLVIPAAIFAALDRPVIAAIQIPTTPVVSDDTRHIFLVLSRIIAFILFVLYICSRVFLHTTPGGEDEEDQKERKTIQHHGEPKVNQYVCIVMLVLSIALVAATMEWFVESVDFLREGRGIQLEWFGLILLPFLSFAADGVITVYSFFVFLIRHIIKGPEPPAIQAQARAIDLSIQFLLFWMPLFVLLSWCIGRPFIILFDFFEIAILVCACFIVNYVIADAKTNWAEGLAMVAFYIMIAAAAWFYPGERSIQIMLAESSVEEALITAAAAANSTVA